MAVTVRIPARLRVDGDALAHHADDLVDAFGAALGRALATADREVLRPRHGRLTVAPGQPTIHWSGPGLSGVSDQTRQDLEERLRRAVAAAVTGAGVAADAATAESDRAAPLSDPPAERLDPTRRRPAMWTYWLPSYDGDGSPRDVPIASPPTYGWSVLPRPPDRETVMRLATEAVGRFGGWPESTSPRGLIMRADTPVGPSWIVLVDGAPPSVVGFRQFGRHSYTPKAAVPFTETPVEPDPGPATAEIRRITDRNALIDVIDETMATQIRFQIQRAEPRRGTTSVAEHDLQLERAVRHEVERRADHLIALLDGRPMGSVVIVRMGNSMAIIIEDTTVTARLRWTGTANLLPIGTVPAARTGGGEPGGGQGGGEPGRGTTGSGPAGGAGSGSGSGAGAGDGDGDGGRPRRGSFVYDPTAPSAADDRRASLFPASGGGGDPLKCQSMNGEPSLRDLGPAGEELRRRIADLAFRLQIEPCEFAANFCIMACRTLQGRAADISRYITQTERPGFTLPVPEGTGDLGPINFRPVASPAIQFLRHLAGVVPSLHALAMRVMRTYESPEHWPKVRGGWMDTPASWNLHFLHEFTPGIKEAVSEIFVTGCQALLLQLLLSSQQGIQARISNFQQYAPIFERLMVSQLSDYAELQRLRDRLRAHNAATAVQEATGWAGGDLTATLSMASAATVWFGAARSLSGAFLASETAQTSAGSAGEIVTVNGVPKIRDSHGVLWAEADLEQALVMIRGEAEGIDPLVKQIADIPDVMLRFRLNRNAIRDELWRVLHEMAANNKEMVEKARDSARWAFKSSQISENVRNATIPGTTVVLQGIHLQVHQQLGEFFGGNVCYALGVDQLFSSELGREALTNFGLTVGIVALSVLCPPAGFLVGVGVALVEVAHAHERARLYASMLDPELVLTRAEVEIGLFAAYLGLALSLVPEAGTAVGAVARGGRSALRVGARHGLGAGLRAGGRTARRFVVRRATRQMIEAASRDLLTEFITQVTTALVMEKIVQKVMEPLLAYLEREAMIRGSVGGPGGARFVLAAIARDDDPPAGGTP